MDRLWLPLIVIVVVIVMSPRNLTPSSRLVVPSSWFTPHCGCQGHDQPAPVDSCSRSCSRPHSCYARSLPTATLAHSAHPVHPRLPTHPAHPAHHPNRQLSAATRPTLATAGPTASCPAAQTQPRGIRQHLVCRCSVCVSRLLGTGTRACLRVSRQPLQHSVVGLCRLDAAMHLHEDSHRGLDADSR